MFNCSFVIRYITVYDATDMGVMTKIPWIEMNVSCLRGPFIIQII